MATGKRETRRVQRTIAYTYRRTYSLLFFFFFFSPWLSYIITSSERRGGFVNVKNLGEEISRVTSKLVETTGLDISPFASSVVGCGSTQLRSDSWFIVVRGSGRVSECTRASTYTYIHKDIDTKDSPYCAAGVTPPRRTHVVGCPPGASW